MSAGQAVISLFLALMWVTCEAASAKDWRFYTRSEFGLYEYNAEDVRHFSKDHLVRVHQKMVLSDKGKTNLVRKLGRGYENVKELILLREIDCTDKKSRILGLIYYSENGEVVNRESYEPIGWDAIISDSVDDILYQVVCE